MNTPMHSLAVSAALVAALALSGCDSLGTQEGINPNTGPQPLKPVASSSVATSALPPLGGAGATAPASGSVNPNLTGTPVLGGQGQDQFATNTSFTDVSGTPPMGGGRDLTGGLTVDKLAGGWTVSGGPTSCRLNLTNTVKAGTTRYRASAPGCQIAGLSDATAWAIAGSQVQLFDESGTLVAALQLSGNRFIGTVAGGTAVTMTA